MNQKVKTIKKNLGSYMNKEIEEQFKVVEKALRPEAIIYDGLHEFYILIKLFYNYMENAMKDKSKEQAKVKKVMKEFESGKLHSGSKKGPVVTSVQQAKAIGMSEARKAGAKIAKKGK